MEKYIKLKCTKYELNILDTFSKVSSVKYSTVMKYNDCSYTEEYPHTAIYKLLVRINEEKGMNLSENKIYSFKKFLEITEDNYVKEITDNIEMVIQPSIYPVSKRLKSTDKKIRTSILKITELSQSFLNVKNDSESILENLKENCEQFLKLYYAEKK